MNVSKKWVRTELKKWETYSKDPMAEYPERAEGRVDILRKLLQISHNSK